MKKSIKGLLILVVLTMIISSISGCTGKKETIVVGAMNVNEMVTLAHVAAQVIEEKTDHEVELNTAFIGAATCHEGMANDEIDVYPNWTGTQLVGILRYEGPNMSQEDTHSYVKQGFEEKFNMTWGDPLGFNNTYAYVVKEEVGEKYNLEKMSDLADYAPEWKLAGDENFDERADGYAGWTEHYGIEFGEVINLQYGVNYGALEADEVEVAAVYSTDSKIKTLGLRILEDDKEFFPAYSGAYVIGKNVRENYPEIIDALNLLAGTIDEVKMVELNLRYDEGVDPAIIAKDFLTEIGLLE